MPPPIYLDTAALLKRYLTERGTPVVTEIISHPASAGRLFTSALTRAEVYHGLNKRLRKGELIDSEWRLAVDLFETHAPLFAIVQITDDVMDDAAALLRTYRLNALGGNDAVHLASALAVRYALARVEADPVFVTSDGDLQRIAAKRGFRTFDPAAVGADPDFL